MSVDLLMCETRHLSRVVADSVDCRDEQLRPMLLLNGLEGERLSRGQERISRLGEHLRSCVPANN